MPKQPTEVKPGQVWRDLDIRSTYDEFTVLSIVPATPAAPAYAVCQRGPRRTRIRVDRLLAAPGKSEYPSGARGYVYVGMQR